VTTPKLRTTSHESGHVNDTPGTPGNTPERDHQALELTLHDGLDRLEEFALMLAFQGSSSQFEILSITLPSPVSPPAKGSSLKSGTDDKVIRLRQALLKKTA